MAAENDKTALLIGASRGLGLGLATAMIDRGWRVVATTRGRNDEGLRRLAEGVGERLTIETLDVNDAAAIAALERVLEGTRLDLLFVSAGISLDGEKPIGAVSSETFATVMETNAFAPLKIIEAIGANVASDGAIVAMTSLLGSVAQNGSGGMEVYRASKAALNMLLRSYAARHKERSVVAMHPGWVRTDMGGANAPLTVADSARGMMDVVAGRLGKPGCVFLDYQGKAIPW